MENQHRKISGYRDLTQAEIDVMNEMKAQEAALGEMLSHAAKLIGESADLEACRWLALARTNLETGMMFAIKAVARPTNGLGRSIPS